MAEIEENMSEITMLRVKNSIFVGLSTQNLQLFDPGGKYFQLYRILPELRYYFFELAPST